MLVPAEFNKFREAAWLGAAHGHGSRSISGVPTADPSKVLSWTAVRGNGAEAWEASIYAECTATVQAFRAMCEYLADGARASARAGEIRKRADWVFVTAFAVRLGVRLASLFSHLPENPGAGGRMKGASHDSGGRMERTGPASNGCMGGMDRASTGGKDHGSASVASVGPPGNSELLDGKSACLSVAEASCRLADAACVDHSTWER